MKTLEELRNYEKEKAEAELIRLKENMESSMKNGSAWSDPDSTKGTKYAIEENKRILTDSDYLDYIILNAALNYRHDPLQDNYFGLTEDESKTFSWKDISGELSKQMNLEKENTNTTVPKL